MKNLRITLLTLLVTGFAQLSWSQLEVSINPLAAIIAHNAKASVEYGISDEIGVELNGVLNTNSAILGTSLGTGFTVGVIGKYYFNPKGSIDGFYLGPYFRYIQYEPLDDLGSNIAVFKRGKAGIFTGYKIVSNRNIVFDFGIGAGSRVFNNFDGASLLPGFDLTGKIAIGYRFNTGGSSSSTTSNRGMNSTKEEMEAEVDDRRKKGKKKKRGKKTRN